MDWRAGELYSHKRSLCWSGRVQEAAQLSTGRRDERYARYLQSPVRTGACNERGSTAVVVHCVLSRNSNTTAQTREQRDSPVWIAAAHQVHSQCHDSDVHPQ